MTLCIAAACHQDNEPRIVLCTDWQQQIENIGGAENRNKMDWVKDGWPALVADTLCHAEELVGIYAAHLKDIELTGANVLNEMKIPARTYKATLANDYISQTLGMEYKDFLRYGKQRLPDELFREKWSEVSRLRLGASLIIAGFAKCARIGPYREELQPFLCVVEDSEEHRDVVRLENDFAAIGSGSYVANASLFHRGQNWEESLGHTIYAVFEAHRFSNKVPGVGEAMTIDVLEPNRIRSLSDKGYVFYEKMFKRFGPREIEAKHEGKFAMDDDFLGTFDTGQDGTWPVTPSDSQKSKDQ